MCIFFFTTLLGETKEQSVIRSTLCANLISDTSLAILGGVIVVLKVTGCSLHKLLITLNTKLCLHYLTIPLTRIHRLSLSSAS